MSKIKIEYLMPIEFVILAIYLYLWFSIEGAVFILIIGSIVALYSVLQKKVLNNIYVIIFKYFASALVMLLFGVLYFVLGPVSPYANRIFSYIFLSLIVLFILLNLILVNLERKALIYK